MGGSENSVEKGVNPPLTLFPSQRRKGEGKGRRKTKGGRKDREETKKKVREIRTEVCKGKESENGGRKGRDEGGWGDWEIGKEERGKLP